MHLKSLCDMQAQRIQAAIYVRDNGQHAVPHQSIIPHIIMLACIECCFTALLLTMSCCTANPWCNW